MAPSPAHRSDAGFAGDAHDRAGAVPDAVPGRSGRAGTLRRPTPVGGGASRPTRRDGVKVSHGRGDPEAKADGFRAAAKAAVALYGDTDTVALAVIADEITTEIALLRASETERDRHAAAGENAYRAVDVDQLARSLPGIGVVGAPMLISVLGNPDWFPKAGTFKAYLGLTPRSSETGTTDRKGQPMSQLRS